MKTVMINSYIHAPSTSLATNAKRSGKPSRPARGPKIGVAVAMVTDELHYAINVSLVNPGRHQRGGKLVGFDKFDKHIATKLAIGKIVSGEPVPHVVYEEPLTHRAKSIQQQVNLFRQQAGKVFKDKEEVIVKSQSQMIKTGQQSRVGIVGSIINWLSKER